MSYENSAGLGVTNHYGGRKVFSAAGGNGGNDVYRTASYVVEDGLTQAGVLPAGATVTEYHTIDTTGTITAVTVGGSSVTGADGTKANNVVVSGGPIVATGITGGKILLTYYTGGDLT